MEKTTINIKSLKEMFPQYNFELGRYKRKNLEKYLAVRAAHGTPELAYDDLGPAIRVRNQHRGPFGLIPGKIIANAYLEDYTSNCSYNECLGYLDYLLVIPNPECTEATLQIQNNKWPSSREYLNVFSKISIDSCTDKRLNKKLIGLLSKHYEDRLSRRR